MIAKLAGLMDESFETFAIVMVGGIGYRVHCSRRTLGQLPAMGLPVTLYIETLVREDAFDLYGFLSHAEQEYFKILQSVQGVGAKAALSLLAVATPEQLTQAILFQDATVLRQADGVGPKLANRIVSELKDKVAGDAVMGVGVKLGSVSMAPAINEESSLQRDAISALVNLGYRPFDVHQAVLKAQEQTPSSLEDLIVQSLQHLSQRGSNHG
jgi:Holliday junction DNA helicase RuvA